MEPPADLQRGGGDKMMQPIASTLNPQSYTEQPTTSSTRGGHFLFTLVLLPTCRAGAESTSTIRWRLMSWVGTSRMLQAEHSREVDSAQDSSEC